MDDLKLSQIKSLNRVSAGPVFQIGELVYSAINADMRGLVTGIIQRPDGHRYYVTWAEDLREGDHYEMELSSEPIMFQPTR